MGELSKNLVLLSEAEDADVRLNVLTGGDSNSVLLPPAAEEPEPITAGSVVQQGAALVGGSIGARRTHHMGTSARNGREDENCSGSA